MADPAVPGPGGEFHLGYKPRLGPMGVLRVWPRDRDEGRGIAPDALELAMIDRPSWIASRRLHAGCRPGRIRSSSGLIPWQGSPHGFDIT
jgi:hypothetical protein